MSPIVTHTVPFPHRWCLPDGTLVTLRAITPADLAMETAFVGGLSPDTSYNRLFSARRPGPDELMRWTNVDPVREEALIVESGSERDGAPFMLAVARYVRDDTGPDAEFAIVVADDWKRRGVGLRLLRGIVTLATDAGIRGLHGSTLATNDGMIALGRRLGFTPRRLIGDSTVMRLTLTLTPV